MAAFRQILERHGASLLPEGGLDEVTESGAVVAGKSIPFHLTAIVSPLRGVAMGLPQDLIDDHGFIRVDACFETPRPSVFAFGDAALLPPQVATAKTMVSIRERVQLLAGNLVARMEGGELKPLQPVTGPHYAMPDIGGRTVFLKDNQVIAKGRIPLLRRFIYDQSYFRLRT